MSSRRARELPIITIGAAKFYLDLRLNEFRDVYNFANRINLDDLYETATGEYKCWFDQKEKNLFTGTQDAFHSNKNAIEIMLPSLEKMDPLGFVWLMEDEGWINAVDAKLKTEELLKEYTIHESGMILQRKPKQQPLLEKKSKRINKPRRKRL